MLLENLKTNDRRIKCGKCKSEYSPREKDFSHSTVMEYDFSCPVCNHGKFQEGFAQKGKQILHD